MIRIHRAHSRLSLLNGKSFSGLLIEKHAALVFTYLFFGGTLEAFCTFLLEIIWFIDLELLLQRLSVGVWGSALTSLLFVFLCGGSPSLHVSMIIRI